MTLSGKTPGATVVTISDARGFGATFRFGSRFTPGSAPQSLTISITGDPASADFVRAQVAASVVHATQVRPGAQVVVGPDDVPIRNDLAQDRVAVAARPGADSGKRVLRGRRDHAGRRAQRRRASHFSRLADGQRLSRTPGRERLLFTADLRSEQPSRFLYFHYNPPGQPDRRVVLRADNHSSQPAIVQFISGRGGPTPNEMEAGHVATRTLPDQRRPKSRTSDHDSGQHVAQYRRAGSARRKRRRNLLQLRLLSGSGVHLTLFAQPATASPDAAARHRRSARRRAQTRPRHLSDSRVLLRDAMVRQRRISRVADRSDSAAQRSARTSARRATTACCNRSS